MKIVKVKKLAANFHGKNEYVCHMGNLKQALNSDLTLKDVQKVIKFNQNARLKQYIGANTNL